MTDDCTAEKTSGPVVQNERNARLRSHRAVYNQGKKLGFTLLEIYYFYASRFYRDALAFFLCIPPTTTLSCHAACGISVPDQG